MHAGPEITDERQLFSGLYFQHMIGSCMNLEDHTSVNGLTYLHIPLMVIGKPKQDRVLDRGILDPGDLSNIGKSRRNNPVLKGSMLVFSHVHRRCLRNLYVTFENVGLANDGSEQQALASASVPMDHTVNSQQTAIPISVA